MQRRVVERTEMLPPGSDVEVGGRRVWTASVIGHGLMAIAYRTEDGHVLKQARGRFDLFRQVLKTEAEASRRLPELGLPAARIKAQGPFQLLKEFHGEPTLQELLIDDRVDDAQRQALLEALERGRRIHAEHGFLVDLSPKNLCWRAESRDWLLLDTGQPLVASASPLETTTSWDAYLAHHGPKIGGRESQPSALTRRSRPDEIDLRTVKRWAFVREWWLWMPFVEDGPEILASFTKAAPDNEILFWRREGGPPQPSPRGDPRPLSWETARARAFAEWDQ